MSTKGHTTGLAARVDIGERWKAGQTDPQIAQALQRPLATVRKWRRRYQQQGRTGLVSPMGRPKTGALGQTCVGVVQAIKAMREAHPGWGPLTLLAELPKDPSLVGHRRPSRSRMAAYLTEQGWARPYQRHQALPQPTLVSVTRPHQEWEMDAQGAIPVARLGRVSLINITDGFSHVKITSLACQHKTHANTPDHPLALRRGFARFGLPEQISLDHDSVFYDNRCGSPFPTRLHVWLIALGVAVRFIDQPPPREHARIERGHQTVTR